MSTRLFLSSNILLWLVIPVSAHDGHDHSEQKSAPQFPAGVVLPAMDGARPWSDKPILDDPDRFQIAIMTDNTGGHRPGIWMTAVERLNLLRPTFVMSVGDLIEGYTDDKEKIEAQWNEFLGFIDRMDMKFFFVAGNHDVSNATAHELWRKHFGTEWYSFDYKGVHFVCLSSEDKKDQIGTEQLGWLEEDLKQHADARWTMLFFHKPLWTISERAHASGNPDLTNWTKVEEYLGDRPHTVFAGHVHHYVQYDRRGMKYYHLATTGGGSQLRGVPYGEFDHVAWLTMEKDGPTVVNLLLDGIVPADAVTEQSITRFREFLAKTRLEVSPILVDDSGISSGRIDLRLRNTFDEPIEIDAEIEGLPLRGLTVEPSGLKLRADSGATTELSVDVRFGEKIDFEHLAQTLLIVKTRTLGGETPLTAERTIPVVIDRKYPCPAASEPVVVDADFKDWNALPLTSSDKPLLVGAVDQWQGPGDASIRFGVEHDDKFVYIAAEVTDDIVQDGDEVALRFDARWIDGRKSTTTMKTGGYVLTVPAPSGKVDQAAEVTKLPVVGSPKMEAATVATIRTKKGWNLEAAIPLKMLTANQSAKWHSFQMTPVVTDVDDDDAEPVRLVWRGTTDFDRRNTNYGHFVRSN